MLNAGASLKMGNSHQFHVQSVHKSRTHTSLSCPGVFILTLVILAQMTPQAEAGDRKMRMCGRRLVLMVKLMCRGELCGPVQHVKRADTRLMFLDALDARSMPDDEEDNRMDDYGQPVDRLGYSAKVKRSNTAQLSKNCCDGSCSFKYLKSFCCPKDEESTQGHSVEVVRRF